jgi:hypothetical protein
MTKGAQSLDRNHVTIAAVNEWLYATSRMI